MQSYTQQNLPGLLFGLLALIAGLLSLCLPETMNIPLAQTIEDGEKLTGNMVVTDCWFVQARLVLLLGSVAVCIAKAVYSRKTFPVTTCWSVCVSVCLSSELWKKRQTGSGCRLIRYVRRVPWMRQLVRFGDWSTGMGNFGGEYGAPLRGCYLVNS